MGYRAPESLRALKQSSADFVEVAASGNRLILMVLLVACEPSSCQPEKEGDGINSNGHYGWLLAHRADAHARWRRLALDDSLRIGHVPSFQSSPKPRLPWDDTR